MSHRANTTPSLNDTVVEQAFFFATCSYNNRRCGLPCSTKRTGQPYGRCDFHRMRYSDYQRRYVQNRGALRVLPYRLMNAEDALGASNDSNTALEAVNRPIGEADASLGDALGAWPRSFEDEQRRLFNSLAETLRVPPPAFTATPPTDLAILYDERDDGVFDGLERELDELERFVGQ